VSLFHGVLFWKVFGVTRVKFRGFIMCFEKRQFIDFEFLKDHSMSFIKKVKT
jgi:hypothetical protein